MIRTIKDRLVALLRRTDRYTRVDTVYVVRGGAILTSADTFLALVSLALSVLIAAKVQKDIYGIYRYVLSVLSIIAAFSLTGMNNAVTRAVSLGREGAFAASLPVQLRYAALQFLVAAGVAGYYYLHGNLTYTIAFAAVALAAPLSGVANTYTAFLNGKREFARMALWRIESGLLNAACLAAVVLSSPTVIALTFAYVLSNLAANAWFLWRAFRKYQPNSSSLPEDLSYGKHLSLMNVATTLASQLDSILIYHLLGPAALAVYSFALLIPNRLRAFLGFMPTIALPRLAARSSAELQESLWWRTVFTTALALIIAGVYALIAPIFFGIFFPAYAESVPYTMLAGLLVLAALPSKYLGTVLTAKGAQGSLYVLSIATPIVKICLSISLITFFGIWGAILAQIGATVFGGVLGYVLVKKGVRESNEPAAP